MSSNDMSKPMSEWGFPGTVAFGAKSQMVRRVQEWLSLQGINVVIDGKFGPATHAAVQVFQSSNGLPTSGTVNRTTWAALVEPMTAAVAEIAPGKKSLGQLAVAYGKQHLAQAPREVGGKNRGPWVRLYMKGHDGSEWAWCAGFACYLIRQAAQTLGVPMPLPYTYSCDSLAAAAKANGTFVDGGALSEQTQLLPGSLFLVRRTSLDWVHTGIVVSVADTTFETIEGNTNDSGESEGYEVCRRTRGYGDKDFALILEGGQE
jgi:hypothetical protein